MWKYTELSYTLAALYYVLEDAYRIIIASGLRPEFIKLGNSGINNWTSILNDAERRNKINDVLDVVLKEYPENLVVRAYRENADIAASKGISSYKGNKTDWEGSPTPSELEKLTGSKSTLMPIHFLEVGLLKSKSVARVSIKGGYGSGFLVADNFFLTNNHVIDSEESAGKAILRFNYQKTIKGLASAFEEFTLDPDNGFSTSMEDDWTLVKVKGDPNVKYGALDLKKVSVKKNDFVNIIQHPGGEHKQIALYHNLVTYQDEKRVQYLTDTLPGSSGSPVFNSDWEIVAIHHSGGWSKEPGTSTPFIRNEGTNINLIIDDLKEQGFIS